MHALILLAALAAEPTRAERYFAESDRQREAAQNRLAGEMKRASKSNGGTKDARSRIRAQLAATRVNEGRFVVKAVDGRNLLQRFYWEVKAVRSDVAELDVEPSKETPAAP